ncbi:MAG: hypothetical protein Q8J64_07515 [Thermodesulfovibrionales bacterium]|nr:hypothetical protein [Thermodesulfovibrionales bacterium]
MTAVTFAVTIGALAFLMGFLLLFMPSVLKRLNELSARMIARVDTITFSYRIGFGISLMIIAAFMFFMAYYFAKRY